MTTASRLLALSTPIFHSIAAFAFLVLLSVSANATLIDNISYVTDTSSGLDWLKLTETTNQSYNDVSAQLGAGETFAGWGYATGTQFDNLVLGLLDGVPLYDFQCQAGGFFCMDRDVYIPAAKTLINMLGDTYELERDHQLTDASAVGAWGLLDDISSGIPGSHYTALMQDIYACIDPAYPYCNHTSPNPNLIATHSQLLSDSFADSKMGSFLVRQSSAVNVPEPSSLTLLVIGLLAVGITRLSRKLKFN